MLRNRATVGEHQPRSYVGGSKKGTPIGDPISAYYPPVIDEATFQAAQEARRRNLLTGRGRKGNNIANLFTGLPSLPGALVRRDNPKRFFEIKLRDGPNYVGMPLQ